jgi:hypothetical protein
MVATLDLPFVVEHAEVVFDMPNTFRTVEPGGRFFAVPGTITPDCKSGNNVFAYPSKLRYRATRIGGVMYFEDGTPTGGATPRTVKEGETVLLQIPSFSLPAGTTCPGKVAATAADTCASCLADGESIKVTPAGKASRRGGNYGNENVKDAQRNRYKWVANALKTKQGRDEWVAYMIEGVRAQTRYIKMCRIHDSGDMMSAAYVAMWRRVARALPDVSFWVSTRSWHGKAGAAGTLLGDAIRGLRTEPNVYVRFSALQVNDNVPTEDPVYGTAVVSHSRHAWLDVNGGNVHLCPAHENGNVCGDCRTCFTPTPVAFRYH